MTSKKQKADATTSERTGSGDRDPSLTELTGSGDRRPEGSELSLDGSGDRID